MKKHLTYYGVFGALTAALLLAGVGCAGKVDTAVDAGLTPITVPLEALNKSKTVTDEERAKQNRDNDAVANEMTVVMVLTENASIPPGTKVGETFGCNDKMAYTMVPRAAATDDVVSDALVSLFAIRESNHNNLYNGLYQSKLSVDKIISPDGVTTEVWLKGTVTSGGVCDDPRIKAQIEGTVKRLRPKYKIFLNGTEGGFRCIGDESGECK